MDTIKLEDKSDINNIENTAEIIEFPSEYSKSFKDYQFTLIPYIASLISFPVQPVDTDYWTRESYSTSGVPRYRFSILSGVNSDLTPIGIPYGKYAMLAFYAVCNYCLQNKTKTIIISDLKQFMIDNEIYTFDKRDGKKTVKKSELEKFKLTLKQLFSSRLSWIFHGKQEEQHFTNYQRQHDIECALSDSYDFWEDNPDPIDEDHPKIVLTEKFYAFIKRYFCVVDLKVVPDLLRKKTSLPLALYVFFCRIEREVRTGNKDPDFYYSYYHLNKLLGANFEHIPMFKQKLKPIVKYINNNKNIHFKLENGYEKHLGTNRDFAVLRIKLLNDDSNNKLLI